MSDAVPLPSSFPAGDATEVADVLAQQVASRVIPVEAIEDLARFLAHDLARRNTARLRLGHLGLLMQMIGDRREDLDPWVSQVEYMEERHRRLVAGEDYPDESALRNAYGSWLQVMHAASAFTLRGGAARTPSSYRHAKVRHSYTLDAIKSGILRCYGDTGVWPTEWEYYEWATIKRLISRVDPEIPGPKQVRSAFGDYATALQWVRDEYERGLARSATQEQASAVRQPDNSRAVPSHGGSAPGSASGRRTRERPKQLVRVPKNRNARKPPGLRPAPTAPTERSV